MNLPAFLRRLFSKVQHKVVGVDAMTLTLDAWRSSASLVDQAKAHSKTEIFKAELQVLKNESPSNQSMPVGTSTTDRLIQQGRTEGYHECLRKLQMFATFKKLPTPIEATFEPPEEKA